MISVKLEYIWMCVLETNQLQIPVEMFGIVLFRGFHNKIEYYNDNIIEFFILIMFWSGIQWIGGCCLMVSTQMRMINTFFCLEGKQTQLVHIGRGFLMTSKITAFTFFALWSATFSLALQRSIQSLFDQWLGGKDFRKQ